MSKDVYSNNHEIVIRGGSKTLVVKDVIESGEVKANTLDVVSGNFNSVDSLDLVVSNSLVAQNSFFESVFATNYLYKTNKKVFKNIDINLLSLSLSKTVNIGNAPTVIESNTDILNLIGRTTVLQITNQTDQNWFFLHEITDLINNGERIINLTGFFNSNNPIQVKFEIISLRHILNSSPAQENLDFPTPEVIAEATPTFVQTPTDYHKRRISLNCPNIHFKNSSVVDRFFLKISKTVATQNATFKIYSLFLEVEETGIESAIGSFT